MSFTQEDLNRAATEAAARATAEAEAAFAAQGSELVRLRGERQAERIGAQITGWLAAGLPPVAAEGMAEFMAAAETGALEFQFTAAGAAAPAKQAPAAWFSAWVDKLLPIVKLGSRSATPGTDPGAAAGGLTDQEVADRARAFQAAHEAKGHHISIGTAIDAVQLGKDKA